MPGDYTIENIQCQTCDHHFTRGETVYKVSEPNWSDYIVMCPECYEIFMAAGTLHVRRLHPKLSIRLQG